MSILSLAISSSILKTLDKFDLRILLVHPRRGVDELLAAVDVLIDFRPIHWQLLYDAPIYKMVKVLTSIRSPTDSSTARAATDRLGPEDSDEWGPGVDADNG